MPKKNDLNRPLEEHGVFWRLESPETKFAGRLITVDSHIEFLTSPQYQILTSEHIHQIFGQFGENPSDGSISVLHGTVAGKPCTLLQLHSLISDGFNDLSRGESVTFSRYQVGLCVLGLHLESSTSESVTSARFSYSALKHWVRIRTDFTNDGDQTVFRFRRNETPLVQHRSALDFSFTFDIKPELRVTDGQVRQRNEAVVELRPDTGRSLDWFFDMGYRLQNYFELMVGSSLRVRGIAVERDGETGWCRRRVRGKTEPISQVICVRVNPHQLATSMGNWLGMPKEFRPFESLLLTIRGKSISVRTKFLAIAQALESFHRLTVRRPTKVIFKRRIEELIDQLSHDFASKLLGDRVAFEAALRTTRNQLTHPGIPLQDTVLTDDSELFMFNQKSEALLRFLVLRNIGLGEDVLTEPIYQQSRRWYLV